MSEPPPPSEPLPRRFGRYVLFDRIGEGGMARLYLAQHRSDLGGERLLVVKLILPILASSVEFSRLLIEEAKLAARLTHGNVVQVIDLGREGDQLYIAMEYVEGFDLAELLKRCSRSKTALPVEFSLFVMIETLRALDYAHRKKDDQGKPLGIVHRDVSPSNVIVSFEGEVKLCDFGIARAMGLATEVPTEAIQGKAGYMSPEAAEGSAVDARSDVFAAGVILWELLAGRRLYRGEGGRPPSLDQAREANIPPLPARGYPDEAKLHSIVTRALAKQPAERFSSAREMQRELEQYVAESALVASPLRFGEWLTEHFGTEIVEQRRARARAAKAGEQSAELDSASGLAAPPPPKAPLSVRTEAVPPEMTPASQADHARPKLVKPEPVDGPSNAALALGLLACAVLAIVLVTLLSR